MDNTKKFLLHIEEAGVHVKRLQDTLPILKKMYPLNKGDFAFLSPDEQDKLDVLSFRFAKLQDLLGTKIFREYLSAMHYPVEDKNFLELLKELDKEKIVDMDLWSEFRGVRNSISHDYPSEEDEKADAINYLVEHIEQLIEITEKIRKSFEAIAS